MEAKQMRTVTLDEFNMMEQKEGITYELIDGVVMMSPRPNNNHQDIVTSLVIRFGVFLEDKPCKVRAEAEVELEGNVLVPDLYVFCNANKSGKQRYFGGPTLVVEVLSPSTAFRDLNVKLRLYEQYGVKEYWIISPNAKTVVVHHFENETAKEYTIEEIIGSDVFEDLKIEATVLFE